MSPLLTNRRWVLSGALICVWAMACQRNVDPEMPAQLPSFAVSASVATSVADLRPNAYTNDVKLTWAKAKTDNGAPVTYAVVYKDTLAKNLTDTTYTIRNVGNNTTVSGTIVARSSKGASSSVPFSIVSGMAPRYRIKKWTSQSDTHRYYTAITYEYDSNGRLTGYDTQEAKTCCLTRGQKTVLTYDQSGRLITAQGLPNGDDTGQFATFRRDYTYDASGRLASVKYYYSAYQQVPLDYLGERKFEYSSTALPVRSIYTTASTQTTYQYTFVNGNLTSLAATDRDQPTTYQYDSKLNPFYGLLSNSATNSEYLTYSKNNLVSTGATYTYDANGFLTKGVASDPKDRIDTYEYEAY